MFLFRLLFASLALIATSASNAQQFNISRHPSMQAVPNFMNSTGEYLFLNRMKEAASWTYVDQSSRPNGNELDNNGYPIYCTRGSFARCAFATNGGFFTTTSMPPQFEKPGHLVLTWTGAGDFVIAQPGVSIVSRAASCTGTTNGNPNECSNIACTAMTASITSIPSPTLVVTSAPGGGGACGALVPGQPISGAGVLVSQFGVPTIITSTGTTGGSCPRRATCYSVNFPQNVPSETMYPGGRGEFVINGVAEPIHVRNFQTWQVNIKASGQSSNKSNTAQYIGFFNVNDESTYWTGQIVGSDFSAAVKPAKFGYLRNLNLEEGVQNNCPTWADRKPSAYFTYYGDEFRASLYGYGSDNIHPNYTLKGSVNQYSVTNLGSSLPVDKQEILVQWGNTANSGTFQFSIDGGATYYPILNAVGNSFAGNQIQSNHNDALMFDAALGGWLEFNESGGSVFPTATGLECGVPPEAFIEINNELGTNPWFVEYYTGADPITDMYTQIALYIRNNFPNMVPAFETPNENWNPCCQQAAYLGWKARAWYLTGDRAWSACSRGGASGCTNQEAGKMASLLGQVVGSVYEYNFNKYRIIQGVWTNQAIVGNYVSVPSFANTRLLSTEYVNQNTTMIPIQSGCAGPSAIQTSCPSPFASGSSAAAYNFVNAVAQTTYWGPAYAGYNEILNGSPIYTPTPQEIKDAYDYWNAGNAAAENAAMTDYMSSAFLQGGLELSVADNAALAHNGFYPWAISCAGASPPATCHIKNVLAYEGGYQNSTYTWIQDAFVSSVVSNASPCVLQLNRTPVGMFPGDIIWWQDNAGGGQWAKQNDFYFAVQSINYSTNQVTINLDCTGFGRIAINGADLYYGADATAMITSSNNGNPCTLNTDIMFTGSASPSFASNGGTLNVRSAPSGSQKLLFGATVTGGGGAGLAAGTKINNIHGGPVNNGTGYYGISPGNQTVSSGSMTASINAAQSGMTVGIFSASGGTWSSINGHTYTVQSANSHGITINLDCSSLGKLTGATLDYVGSFNWTTYLKAQSYISTDLNRATQNALQQWFGVGITEASQFNIGGNNAQQTAPLLPGAVGAGDPWFGYATDIYGYFGVAYGQGTVSGNVLNVTGAVLGRLGLGQTLVMSGITGIYAGATSNTIITGSAVNSATCGALACTGMGGIGTYLLSHNSTISSTTSFKGAVQGATAQWNAYSTWNGSAR